MAKAKKLPSGNWRVQVYVGRKDGKKVMRSITAASKGEAEYEAMQITQGVRVAPSEYTVHDAMEQYIRTRTNVLSPSTIQGYEKIMNHNLQSLMDKKIKKLTQDDIQAAVNDDAAALSSKSIKNAHGLLSAVLGVYRPDMRMRTSIPQPKKKYKELPQPEAIYAAVKGSRIELAALLAMWLSFSMSEIRGIKKSDTKDGVLTLNRVIVDIDGEPITKDSMKAYERSRRHVVPPFLLNMIKQCAGEFIVPLNANQIDWTWRRLRDKAGLPHSLTFHDLRHVNASVMHLLGVPDKYAMERGGWKTDQTMKAVYQNVFTDERLAVDKKVNEYFLNIVSPHDISHRKEKSP